MLQAMRDKVTGILGWIVIGLIIITFALFGLGSYLQDKSRVYAARVNDVEITPRDLQNAYQQQRAQLEQQMGESFDPAAIDERQLRKTALDTLVQQQLILQQAEAEGFMVSDQYLAGFIHALPSLQEEGVFSKDLYQRLLYQKGMTPAEFEADVRRRLLSTQYLQGLTETAFVTDSEINEAYQIQHQARDFEYLMLSHMSLFGESDVSDAEVEAFYNDNTDQFMAPEKVKLAFVRLRKSELAKGVEVDPTELEAYYNEKKQGLAKQEQRRASHILIQVDADADEAAISAARDKAQAILEKVRAGESFETLARENSEDPGSADNGGDLGYFAKGSMVPEFDEAVFAMQVGETSDLVRSQYGFHIIRLTDIKASKIPDFEEAKAELKQELQMQKASDLFYDELERLTDISYENPHDLQPVADALGLEIEQSDWIWKNNPQGLGQYPKVVAAAFSEDVLEAGNNSEPVEISPDEVIVLRVTDRQAAHLKPLEEVRTGILARLNVMKASELAEKQGEALLQQAREGTPLKDLEKSDAVSYAEVNRATLATQGQNPYLMKKVFQIQTDTLPALEGFHLQNGDYAIVRLKAIHTAELEKMSETEKQQLRRGIEAMRRTAALSALIDDLRSAATIDIPEEEEP